MYRRPWRDPEIPLNVVSLLAFEVARWAYNVAIASVVEWFGRKPNWFCDKSSCLIKYLYNLQCNFFSKIFEVDGYFGIIRHSRLPAGNALWFCQNFFFFFFFFLFFRRQGFRMITFDRQAGPLQNFNRSHIMVIGRSVSFSDPARPPGGGVGRPKHPKIPPPPPKFFCLHAF